MVITAQNTQLKPDYKQTEVGMIPADWDVQSVEEIADVTTGDKDTKDKIDSGAYPFFVRSQNVERINSYSHDGEAVLTAGDGVGVGKVFHYANGKFDFHQRVYMIYNFRKCHGFFFYLYFSNNFYKEATKYNAKNSVDSVRREMVTRMKIPLPPPSEQRAIATALSDVDALITSLDRLIAKKRDIKQATMQQLLTGKIRLPGFSEEWEVRKLGEIAEIDSDNLSSNTHPDYSFKYISLEDVDTGVLNRYSEINFRDAPSRARRKVKKNDILISTVRPNLKSHLHITDDIPDLVCSTGFSVLRCCQASTDPSYVYFHLFAEEVGRQIESLLIGSNYPAINGADVRALRIPFPPLPEQQAIADILSDMDAEISALEQKRDKTRALKQGMMRELLTGKTRLL